MLNKFYIDHSKSYEDKKPITKTELALNLVSICLYFLVFLVLGSVVTIAIVTIVSSSNNVSYETLFEIISKSDFDYSTISDPEKYKHLAALVSGWSNFLIYVLLLAVIIPLLFRYLKEDAFKIKNYGPRFIILLIAAAFVFYCSALVYEKIVGNFVSSDSSNQEKIVNIIKNGGLVPMFISTVFLAPILEELIYRKALIKLMKPFRPWLQIVISALIFALPHMLSTGVSDFSSAIKWVLLLSNYFVCGAVLGIIYKKSDENIYVSMFAHFINNLISMMIILCK